MAAACVSTAAYLSIDNMAASVIDRSDGLKKAHSAKARWTILSYCHGRLRLDPGISSAIHEKSNIVDPRAEPEDDILRHRWSLCAS